MKAAVLKSFGSPLSVEELPVPKPGKGEVLVKVAASGLCLTDVHIRDGIIRSVMPPLIPGHEMAGVVAELGEGVSGLEPGRHVVCGIDITCGTCSLCTAGHENLCRERVRIGFERDGSHAEYAVVPASNLYPIANSVPLDQASIIPDAVACMYHAIVDVGKVKRGNRVLLNGAGGLGLQGVQILKWIGAEIFVSARTQAKLEKAGELGADHMINVSRQELSAALSELTGGGMCDVIFDMVGGSDTMGLLLRCLRSGGKIVALGYAAPEFTVNYQELVIKEKQIVGLRGSTRQNMLDCIRLVENGTIVPLVTDRFSLDEINEALARLEAGKGIGRSVLVMED